MLDAAAGGGDLLFKSTSNNCTHAVFPVDWDTDSVAGKFYGKVSVAGDTFTLQLPMVG